MKKIVMIVLIMLILSIVLAKVENSGWDASVYQVKTYLKENLKDPKSIEYIEWSNVVRSDDYYMVRCKYRARNSFGGYVIENKIFFINVYSEKVEYYIDYEG